MKNQDLLKLIDSFTKDIEFEYKGIHGLIEPLSRDKNITLSYGDDDVVLKTADEVMAYPIPIFDRKCLNDICEQTEFW